MVSDLSTIQYNFINKSLFGFGSVNNTILLTNHLTFTVLNSTILDKIHENAGLIVKLDISSESFKFRTEKTVNKYMQMRNTIEMHSFYCQFIH